MIKIPKIIHFIWIGDETLPNKYKENVEGYRGLNPFWKIVIWDNSNLPKIKNEQIYKKMTTWAAKADILRLEILAQYGGLYTDIDSKCWRPLDGLVDELTCFGMCGNDGEVANGTLGCTKGHPAFKKLVEELENHINKIKQFKRNRKKGTHVLKIAGEGYITKILKEFDDFTRIDDSKNKGSRRLICTTHETKLSDCYIFHELARSWHHSMRIKL